MADESDKQPPSTEKPSTQGNNGGMARSDAGGLGNGVSGGAGFGFGMAGGDESPWRLIDPKEVVPDYSSPAPSFAPSLGTRSPGTRCADPVRTIEIATWLGPALAGYGIGALIGGAVGVAVRFAGSVIGAVVGGPTGPTRTADDKDDMIRGSGTSSPLGPRASGMICEPVDDVPRGKNPF